MLHYIHFFSSDFKRNVNVLLGPGQSHGSYARCLLGLVKSILHAVNSRARML